jgi:NodT family efflux transporter outer membrane factor (OMF) lipoprotein
MKVSKNIYTGVVFMALAAMTTSCGIYKKYETPQNTALTAAYVEARDAEVDSTALGNLLWEDVFTDPVLADLINIALKNNTSLKDAKINVEIAQAQLKGAKLAYLPSVALAPNGAGASYAGSSLSWSYTIPATVSWEVDVFGKLLNSKRSAAVGVELSEAYAQAVRSQIICAVANTYYAMSAIESQLALSRSTAVLWEQSVQTMRDLKAGARVTEAAVVQSDANYRSVLASITDLEVTRHELDNTMSVLLNTMPQHWDVAADKNLDIPVRLSAGVPMQYLAQRPDVTAAERGLASAYYATASARAAFYPSLAITANGGFTNLLGSIIKNPGEWFYNIAGQLTAPLFSRGQNITRLKVAKLQQEQAMNAFENTVLSAAGEVSNALTVYQKAGERASHLDVQVEDLQNSVSYTNDLLVYSTGTYLEVLTAQQSLLSAQMGRINCDLTRNQAIISLYQAMGGGR